MAVVRRRARTPQAPKYTENEVIALSEKYDEPQWLRDFRLDAWKLYEQIPMPYLEEEWRRTDYRHVDWSEADKLISANGVSADVVPPKNLEPLMGDTQGGLIVFVDGKLVHSELAEELTNIGVIFSDLQTASRENGDLVRKNFMTQAVKPADGKFAALHGAMWTHGVFVYVPKGKVAELPLHIVNYNTQDGASMGHVLVVVEENAQATVQVDYASADGSAQSSYIGATELLVGDYANLRYVSLQEWNRDTFEFSHQRGRIGRDANLDWIIGNMGSRLTKAFIEVDIDGIGSTGRVSGFFFADKNQFFDLDTQQNHNAPLTESDLLFKGAAKDKARTLWQGMIKSLPQMQKIDGYQVCRNLMLSD